MKLLLDPESVSCRSPVFCAVVNGPEVFNGRSWRQAGQPLTDPRSVSCSSRKFCVVVGGGRRGKAEFSTYNGHSWSAPVRTDPGQTLVSVSCPVDSFCIAVDQAGKVVVINGSSAARPTTVDHQAGLNSVSCPTYWFCEATDLGGDALSYVAPRLGIRAAAAAVRRGRVRIQIGCAGPAQTNVCTGSVSLIARVRTRARRRGHGELRTIPTTKTRTIARGRYAVRTGGKSAVALQVSGSALQTLTRTPGHRLATKVRATLTHGRTEAATVVLIGEQ